MFINILNIWPGRCWGILHFYSICYEGINVSLIIKKKLEFYGSVRGEIFDESEIYGQKKSGQRKVVRIDFIQENMITVANL